MALLYALVRSQDLYSEMGSLAARLVLLKSHEDMEYLGKPLQLRKQQVFFDLQSPLNPNAQENHRTCPAYSKRQKLAFRTI